MNDLKVATRLMILIGVLAALMVGIGAYGLRGIAQSNDALRAVYELHTARIQQIGDIQALLLSNRLAIAVAQVTPTPEVIAENTLRVETNIAAVTKVWEVYMAGPMTMEMTAQAKAFAESRRAFVAEGLKPAVQAMRGGDLTAAQQVVLGKVRPLYEPVRKGIEGLERLALQEARQAYEEATARYATTRLLSLMAIGAGLLFGGLFGWIIVRSIGRQLGAEPGEAAAVASRVAAGDLSVPIGCRPGDTSSLMAQLGAMQKALLTVVGQVRGNAESVATASTQIAQANLDLSQRTEEQASALQETASSMEQLSSTVKHNANNAAQASQLAQGASTVASRGGAVVGQVVETMKGIDESSRRMAEIISVIDGIAFQTNILALNAAVEAARAGEEGRGFAVVAGEVRSLAQRSADAAKQIKELISGSVERAAQGSQLVDEAGQTMSEIVTVISRVSDIVAEISAASAEQSTGVSQVGQAVSQMDQVTQQNAALVEESAAAADGLKKQAQQLLQAVSVFRLSCAD